MRKEIRGIKKIKIEEPLDICMYIYILYMLKICTRTTHWIILQYRHVLKNLYKFTTFTTIILETVTFFFTDVCNLVTIKAVILHIRLITCSSVDELRKDSIHKLENIRLGNNYPVPFFIPGLFRGY